MRRKIEIYIERDEREKKGDNKDTWQNFNGPRTTHLDMTVQQ